MMVWVGNDCICICFEFDQDNSETWHYPDDESFNANIKLLESILNMPGEKLSVKIDNGW